MPVRFQVDGDFYDHPKTIDASDAAVALWTRAGSYSTAKLLDGFVPEGMLARLSRTPEQTSQELVSRGLWRRVKGGYQFHQWRDRNLTRDRVEQDRARDRDRKREERGHTSPVTHTVACHGCGHTYVTARSDSKYCSARCRKRGSRNTDPQVGTEVVRPDVQWDSEGIPDGFRPVSVSVSVSESVSGSGRDASASPSPRCPDHVNVQNPPACGQCAEARKAREAWEAERRQRAAQAPRCRVHRGQPAHNCGPCSSEAKAGEAA